MGVDYNKLQALVMKQAQEKGFGTTPNEISVPEKMALIHSEISECYQAILDTVADGKDGYKQELGDVLQRTLHVGGMFNVDFRNPYSDDIGLPADTSAHYIARLHQITSRAYEHFRKNRIDGFKQDLNYLAHATEEFAEAISTMYGKPFSLELAILDKVATNKDRDWHASGYNERFTQE